MSEPTVESKPALSVKPVKPSVVADVVERLEGVADEVVTVAREELKRLWPGSGTTAT